MPLHELTTRTTSLEEAFLALTTDADADPMMRLINGELIKVRTTRTALGFGVASVLLVLALVLISFLAGDPTTAGDKRDALNVGGVLSVPLLIFGIVGATGEYRHRTIAPAVLIAPGRARLTVARLIAYMLTGLVFGAAMVIVAFVVGLPLAGGGEALGTERPGEGRRRRADRGGPHRRARRRASGCSCATRWPASSAR